MNNLFKCSVRVCGSPSRSKHTASTGVRGVCRSSDLKTKLGPKSPGLRKRRNKSAKRPHSVASYKKMGDRPQPHQALPSKKDNQTMKNPQNILSPTVKKTASKCRKRRDEQGVDVNFNGGVYSSHPNTDLEPVQVPPPLPMPLSPLPPESDSLFNTEIQHGTHVIHTTKGRYFSHSDDGSVPPTSPPFNEVQQLLSPIVKSAAMASKINRKKKAEKNNGSHSNEDILVSPVLVSPSWSDSNSRDNTVYIDESSSDHRFVSPVAGQHFSPSLARNTSPFSNSETSLPSPLTASSVTTPTTSRDPICDSGLSTPVSPNSLSSTGDLESPATPPESPATPLLSPATPLLSPKELLTPPLSPFTTPTDLAQEGKSNDKQESWPLRKFWSAKAKKQKKPVSMNQNLRGNTRSQGISDFRGNF
jgi:hypothetical protein